MRIDIILVTYNRLNFTKQTIKSILERTKFPYRLIVVDNFSTDGTREFLLKEKQIGNIDTVVFNSKNLGLESALIQGFNLVESDYFVTVDNDCIAPLLKPCWLEQLIGLITAYSDFGAIALRPQVLIGVGPIFEQDREIISNNVCGGSYRIMNTKLIKDIGAWTNKFENDGRGNEEHDICSKIRQKGYKVGYTKNIFCYHLFGDEGTWGYDKESNFRMGRTRDKSPEDQEYNPITCEPKIKSNE